MKRIKRTKSSVGDVVAALTALRDAGLVTDRDVLNRGWSELREPSSEPPRVRVCGHRHRSPRTLVACLFPRATFLGGRGPWAVVSECPSRHFPRDRYRTVTLHPDISTALAAKATIDSDACGHACINRHRIYEVNR